jgi:hypothetical protein
MIQWEYGSETRARGCDARSLHKGSLKVFLRTSSRRPASWYSSVDQMGK